MTKQQSTRLKMKEQNKLGLAFTISTIFTIIVAYWFISSILNDFNLLLSNNICKLIGVFVFLCFIFSMYLLKKLLVELRYEIDSHKEKERNVRDIYLYNQLLDPPTTNN